MKPININMKQMKKNLLFLLAIFAFIYSDIYGQTTIEKYENKSIYLHGNKYVKGGKKYPLGFLGMRLGEELEVSLDAVIEWKKYKKSMVHSFVALMAGAVAAGVGSVVYRENKDLGVGLVIGGYGAVFYGVPLSIQSQRSMHKAVWLYNRDILR